MSPHKTFVTGAAALVATAALALAGSAAVATTPETGPKLALPGGQSASAPWIAAHRGQWRIHPENSIPAITQAIADGAQVVEIDVQRTKDGHLVLMHDATVNRTTNGTGRVDELTLDQVRQLRLRKGMGNGPAPLTDLRVPTLGEVLDAVKGKSVLLNLDKGWPIREQMYTELAAKNMVEYGLFKGAPNAAEATEFMTAHPDALYMHVVNDAQAGDFEQFTTRMPVAFELVYNTPDDVQAQPAYFAKVDAVSEIWINTMWSSLANGQTDEASLRDPALGWATLVAQGADILQTDNVRTLNAWRSGADVTRIGMKNQSIRVQAEDFVDDPAKYFDANPRNECGTRAIRNPNSPVDACDLDGAHIVQYIRDREWFTLPVTVDQPGNWSLSIRHSADTEPGGTVSVDTGAGYGKPVALPNPTHNRAFIVTDLGQIKLEKGTTEIRFKFTHSDYASVDWIQLDRGNRADRELLR